MIASLFSFLWILAIVILAFGNSKFMLPRLAEQSFVETLSSEFWATIDEERVEAGSDGKSSFFILMLLEPIFALFVLLILMNVLVTLLTALYEAERDKAEVTKCCALSCVPCKHLSLP